MVTISECKSRKSLRLFEKLPELIHRDIPWFVPAFPGSITKMFKPTAPFPKRHGKLFPFIAYKDGVPVGRITAIVNHTHNQYHQDKVGFFGFFDFINDYEVAKALFEQARETLANEGLNIMRGPYNPTVNDELGVLVEGFDSAPLVLMPYNPPYYVDMYAKLGVRIARNLQAFYLEASAEAPERIRKIVERVKRSLGLNIRNINMKKLPEELHVIQTLYNQTLDRNWGFVPITYEDLEFTAEDLKAIVDPSMVLIAERDGKAVGFSMALPDINELMLKAKSSSNTLIRVLRFIWYLKTAQPKRARLAVLGVLPEYRNKGIAALFYYESLMRGKSKFEGGELSWIDEDNEEIVKGITVMGGHSYKRYRIYEAPIQGALA